MTKALTIEAPDDTGCSFSLYGTPFIIDCDRCFAELINRSFTAADLDNLSRSACMTSS